MRLPVRLALLFLAAGLAPLAVSLLVLAPGQGVLRTSESLLLTHAMLAHAAGWTLLALIATLLSALFFAHGITRPVADLARGATRLAEGAFGTEVPVSGPPEIAEVARIFNAASRRLARYHRENRELLREVERGYIETLRTLVNAIEAKDPYTAGHSQRTAEWAVAIGRKLGLNEEEQKELEFGGLLHDIGKIGIAEQILRKPARLDPPEMEVMRGHPTIGDGIVHDVALLKAIRPMVRNHHERFDGSGYPDRLRGEAIPLGARIITVADTYDAITSDRCYQEGRSPEAAIGILRQLAGNQLDGEVVEALVLALVELGVVEAAAAAAVPAAEVPPAAPAERPRRPTLDFLAPPEAAGMAAGKKG